MLASFVVGGLVALSLALSGVAQAQSSCDAGVTKAAGKKVACKTKVIAKAQQRGVAVDTVKLAKCESKFTSSCTKAQSKGDCTAQTQPCDAIEATADACVDDLSGGSPTTTSTTTASTTTTSTTPTTTPTTSTTTTTIPGADCPCFTSALLDAVFPAGSFDADGLGGAVCEGGGRDKR